MRVTTSVFIGLYATQNTRVEYYIVSSRN